MENVQNKITYNKLELQVLKRFKDSLISAFFSNLVSVLLLLCLIGVGIFVFNATTWNVLGIVIVILGTIITIPVALSFLYSFKLFLFAIKKKCTVFRVPVTSCEKDKNGSLYTINIENYPDIIYFDTINKGPVTKGTMVDVLANSKGKPIAAIPTINIVDVDAAIEELNKESSTAGDIDDEN